MRNLAITGLLILSITFFATCKKDSTSTTQIPTNGLILWYPMNGNCSDSSGHKLNGTVHGATLTTDRFGHSNSAYAFNGSGNQWIDCGVDTLFKLLPNMSISAWVYLNQNASDKDIGYIIAGTYNGLDQGILYNVGEGPKNSTVNYLSFRWSGPTPEDTVTNLKLNTWYNVIITFDGSKINLYVNGILGSSTSNNNTVNVPFDHLYIGGSGSVWEAPVFNMNGKIDDVLIYNRVLTSSEISDIYNAKD